MTTKGSTLARATEDRFNGLSPSELNEMEKQSLVALALSLLANRHRAGVLLSSPDETRSYLRLRLAERKNEVFGCVFLDNRHRVIEVTELFQGTIEGVSILGSSEQVKWRRTSGGLRVSFPDRSLYRRIAGHPFVIKIQGGAE